jgi:hypothetical protein
MPPIEEIRTLDAAFDVAAGVSRLHNSLWSAEFSIGVLGSPSRLTQVSHNPKLAGHRAPPARFLIFRLACENWRSIRAL